MKLLSFTEPAMAAAAIASLSLLLHFCFLSLSLLLVNSADHAPVEVRWDYSPTATSPPPPCSDFKCGNFSNMSFPFTEDYNLRCGLFPMKCSGYTVTKLGLIDGRSYLVKSISNSTDPFTVQDSSLTELLNNGICDLIIKFTPPTSPHLQLNISGPFLKIFVCKSGHYLNISGYSSIRYYSSCRDTKLYFSRPEYESQQDEPQCPYVFYPLLKMLNNSEWEHFNFLSSVYAGFALQWVLNEDCVACQKSGGRCGYDDWRRNFMCYCKDGHHGKDCIPGRKPRTWMKVVIGSSAAFGTVLLAGLLLVVWRGMSNLIITKRVSKNPKRTKDLDKFLKNHRTQMPQRYSYSDIRKMTNYLKSKLGEGGFGSVFRGQLRDGRPVAVKILSDSKGKGQDFINEVAAISRTSHVNIVRLVGFCFQGSHRALVYEFMANGSLEKFIFDKNPKHGPLGWEKLFQIALGIARGLEYLHRGCNMRILHFDIKPHNILLDQDFCPKISDFGLAKLCPDKESIVSMTAARGTVGYIAPEVMYRSLGGVSQKSDVYSYGMLLLEMVGGRKNIDAGVENTSEIYFPDWIYNRLNKPGDLLLDEVLEETDDELVRKLILVGLWCIQTKPMDRPTMSKVVEMLEGNLQVLQMPPKPFLYSLSEAE